MTVNTTVSYVRPELEDILPQYDVIRDCLKGSVAVKAKGETYLPKPNPDDTSIENNKLYASYKKRAVFYNATRQTFAGLMGQVFTRDPLIEIPEQLSVVSENIDGSHINLTQLAKIGVGYVLPYGRCGFLADYTSPENGLITIDDIKTGKARPTIKVYAPENIINWRYETDANNYRRLTLVVLKETYIESDTGFAYIERVQYRELRLVNGVYTSTIHKTDAKGNVSAAEPVTPTNSKGKTFDKILFSFAGSENNTADIDQPPMFDIADLNIAHYINSADYETNIHLVGNPTPWVSGLTAQWITEVWKGGFRMGSTTAVPLPRDAQIGMICAGENGIVKEALDHKERQMVAFGAKLVEQRTVERTATEAGLEASAENSTLVSVVKNVAHSIVEVLNWSCEFMGITPTELKFELNTDFAISKLKPDEVASLIKSWLDGAISWDEMRIGLRKGNLPLTADAIAKKAIEDEQAKQQENDIALANATKPATNNFPK